MNFNDPAEIVLAGSVTLLKSFSHEIFEMFHNFVLKTL
jgi:hypothetical protein